MDTLSLTFAALADPTRRAILMRLTKGEATVNELAAPFDLRLPSISKHLAVLKRAGLVSQSRNAQWRPCRLEAEPLKAVADWTFDYREFWEESWDRLDELLQTQTPSNNNKKSTTSKKPPTTRKKAKG
jgi:DNA-binding transcriptional ArsR family regulator